MNMKQLVQIVCMGVCVLLSYLMFTGGATFAMVVACWVCALVLVITGFVDYYQRAKEHAQFVEAIECALKTQTRIRYTFSDGHSSVYEVKKVE